MIREIDESFDKNHYNITVATGMRRFVFLHCSFFEV